MASLNKVQLIGRLGQDPILKKTTANGVSVVNIRVATNEEWTDDKGQKHENTTWHTVVCWARLAEVVAQYTNKGRQIYIEGRLQTREYIGKATDANGQPILYGNGQPVMVKKTATEIVAFSVLFLGSKPTTTAYDPTAGIAVNPAAMAGGVPFIMNDHGVIFSTPVTAPAPNFVMPNTNPAPGNVAQTFTPPFNHNPGNLTPANALFANTTVPAGV
jgi:single-strand DNA-binding protein